MIKLTLICITLAASSLAQFDPHFVDGRSGIVHLFEWKWDDIARECEQFLGPNNFGGVQLSPVTENAIVSGRPWFERYQPISYFLGTRSGNAFQLQRMIRRCNDAGVRVYVDAVFNHMAAAQTGSPQIRGTAGWRARPGDRLYLAVPYGKKDFHPTCSIQNYGNATEVRVCELSGLPDLDQGREDVRNKIVTLLNKLVDMGVAGFRIDGAKHMFPKDLEQIYSKVNNLRPIHGFPRNSRPFIYQEVIDLGNEAVSKKEYTRLGVVTEFTYSSIVGQVFQAKQKINNLEGLGPNRALLPSNLALTFVDNHDNQRGHGGAGLILTHQKRKEYISAVTFLLSHNYGIKRLMSSFAFSNPSQGPPHTSNDDIVSPEFDSEGQCRNGWVCEHRWPQIRRMIAFQNAVGNSTVTNWNVAGDYHLSFCRKNIGCVAFNTSPNQDFTAEIQTDLGKGVYCDVISGAKTQNECTGKKITVDKDGKASISIAASDTFGAIAFYSYSQIN